ncbi:SRPBCC family protein [Adhaeribacter sp. BT258]|uniref:SRPBCC family protein n=1 Tax=Adhaeribacter terrigena TaxID=2793070 RepID=A0ABS1BYS6_9BACT|nr:SRPBCC family protein [Adhaeribacter terrigena]MBK0401538.1 SRPBCC family protein [Adhaeribacter terrigena]
METTSAKTSITVETTVNAPVEKVWQFWTAPEHITQWNSASEDWHTPSAENDPRTGGKFKSRMEAKDGSVGFDFEGVYDEVKPNELIAYAMPDGRKVKITFAGNGHETKVTETFDAEGTHSDEMQRAGWQAILDNFKKYVEAN